MSNGIWQNNFAKKKITNRRNGAIVVFPFWAETSIAEFHLSEEGGRVEEREEEPPFKMPTKKGRRKEEREISAWSTNGLFPPVKSLFPTKKDTAHAESIVYSFFVAIDPKPLWSLKGRSNIRTHLHFPPFSPERIFWECGASHCIPHMVLHLKGELFRKRGETFSLLPLITNTVKGAKKSRKWRLEGSWKFAKHWHIAGNARY